MRHSATGFLRRSLPCGFVSGDAGALTRRRVEDRTSFKERSLILIPTLRRLKVARRCLDSLDSLDSLEQSEWSWRDLDSAQGQPSPRPSAQNSDENSSGRSEPPGESSLQWARWRGRTGWQALGDAMVLCDSKKAGLWSGWVFGSDPTACGFCKTFPFLAPTMLSTRVKPASMTLCNLAIIVCRSISLLRNLASQPKTSLLLSRSNVGVLFFLSFFPSTHLAPIEVNWVLSGLPALLASSQTLILRAEKTQPCRGEVGHIGRSAILVTRIPKPMRRTPERSPLHTDNRHQQTPFP